MKATKKKKFEFGEAVQIVWRDTSGHAGWMSLHDLPMKAMEVVQIGYFMLQDKDSIHICQGIPTAHDECQVIAPTVIPMGCVSSIKRMHEA